MVSSKVIAHTVQGETMEYPATTQAREWAGDDYAEYIQESLEDKVARGYRTHEETMALDIGQLFIGNDGE